MRAGWITVDRGLCRSRKRVSKTIDRALTVLLLVILASLAAHAMPAASPVAGVGGVLAAGLDPVAAVLQRVLARGNS